MDGLGALEGRREAAGVEVTVGVGFGDRVAVIEKAANRLRTDMVILGGNSGGWLERHVGLAKYGRRLSQKLSSTVLTVQPKDRKEKVPEAA